MKNSTAQFSRRARKKAERGPSEYNIAYLCTLAIGTGPVSKGLIEFHLPHRVSIIIHELSIPPRFLLKFADDLIFTWISHPDLLENTRSFRIDAIESQLFRVIERNHGMTRALQHVLLQRLRSVRNYLRYQIFRY